MFPAKLQILAQRGVMPSTVTPKGMESLISVTGSIAIKKTANAGGNEEKKASMA